MNSDHRHNDREPRVTPARSFKYSRQPTRHTQKDDRNQEFASSKSYMTSRRIDYRLELNIRQSVA